MNTEPDPTLSPRVAQAGADLYRAVCDSIADARGTHLETAIAAAGYLAGTAILTNCGVNLSALTPGAPVFVDRVNEVGPAVVKYMMDLTANSAPPAASIPPDRQPLRSYDDLLPLLWPKFQAILTRHSIPRDYAAFAGAAAAAQMIVAGQAQLTPAIGKAIAVDSIVKASKTVPNIGKAAGAPVLNTREDFFRMLADATVEVDDLAAREPAYPVWGNLQRQLHAMREWTVNGATPTPEQAQRISIGLVVARELEPAVNEEMAYLIARLHQLNYYWKQWTPTRNAAPFTTIRKPFMILLIMIVGALLLIGAFASVGGLKVKSPVGSPLGRSVRTTHSIATLIETMEPYTVSLNHNPRDERFRVGLFLRPIDVRLPGRLFPIAGGLQRQEFAHDARILGEDGDGEDGDFLWFYAGQIGALKLKTGKLITARDLQRANPSLDDVWINGRYELRQRLIVSTHDYQRIFEIDPATLKAIPSQAKFGMNQGLSDQRPEHYLTSGALVSPTEWFGVHTAAEVERDFKPGSRLSGDHRADKTRAARRIYRGRVDETPFGPRIASMTPLTGEEYLDGALLRIPADSGFLLTCRGPTNPAVLGTLFIGTLCMARVDQSGKLLWKADTGIGDLEQILPDTRSVAFVGAKPRVQDKVPEPILVIVDNQSGAISTTSLWQ